MKASRCLVAAGLTLFSILSLTANMFSASSLSSPNGLAVDSSGNLYVANFAASNILVYGPDYQQITSKTITAGISFPISVAFDPLGNLWVLNVGTNSVTQYTNGVQNQNATITNGISGPFSMTVDGIGNVYVQNGDANITVYSPTSPTGPASSLVQTIVPSNCIQCLGGLLVSGQALYWGKGNGAELYEVVATSQTLLNGKVYGRSTGVSFGTAMGAAQNSNAYLGTIGGAIYLAHPDGTSTLFIANVGFDPWGIAVDNARKRVYITNQYGDQIAVYSTAGVLLHTIT